MTICCILCVPLQMAASGALDWLFHSPHFCGIILNQSSHLAAQVGLWSCHANEKSWYDTNGRLSHMVNHRWKDDAARQHRALAGRKREGAVCICKTVFFSAIPLIINEQYVPRKAVLYYFVLIYSCAHRTWGIWLMSSNNLPCLQWQIVYFSLSLSF